MAFSSLISELSARANALRTSMGTARQTEAANALKERINVATQIVNAGRPAGETQQVWDQLVAMLARAQHTLQAEGIGAGAEEWSDILTARLHAARTTPNQTTIGALMEAVNRASAADMSREGQLERDELEDLLAEANQFIQQATAGSPSLHIPRDARGNPTGAAPNTLFAQATRWLWPIDKPLYARPGFLLGSALAVGVLAQRNKALIKKTAKRLKA
jgi:hypothetical protein